MSIEFDVKANDKFSNVIDRGFNKIRDNANQYSGVVDHCAQRLGIFSKEGIAMGVGFAITNKIIEFGLQMFGKLTDFIGGSVDAYKEWQDAIVRTSNQLTDQEQVLLPRIITQVKELGRTYEESSVKLLAGFTQVHRAGFSVSSSLMILDASEKLAKVDGAELTTTISLMTGAMRTWKIEATDSSDTANKLNVAMDNTTFGAEDLYSVITTLGPIVEQMNVGFDDFLALLVTLNRQGFDSTGKVTRILNSSLTALIDPGEKAADVFKKYGIVLDPIITQGEGLIGTIRRVTNATDDQIGVWNTLLGSGQAVSVMLALTSNNMQDFAEAQELIGDNAGDLDKDFKNVTQTLSWEFGKWGPIMRGLQRDMGGSLFGNAFNVDDPEMKATLAQAAKNLGYEFNEKLGTVKLKFNYGPLAQHEFMPYQIANNWGNQVADPRMKAELKTLSQEFNKVYVSMKGDAAFQAKSGPVVEYFTNLNSKIVELAATYQLAVKQRDQYEKDISDLSAQKSTLETIHKYTQALQAIPLAFTNAAYSNRIFDDSTRALVDHMRSEYDQIKELEREGDAYSLAGQKNSLAMMKIQQAALGNRGRMTRDQKQQMKTLQAAELDLQIKELENQIQIGEIKQDGLTDEEERLDQIKTDMQVYVADLNDSYQKDMDNLQTSIDYKQGLVDYYTNTFIPTSYQNLVDAQQTFSDDLKAIEDSYDWTAEEKTRLDDLLSYTVLMQKKILAAREATASSDVESNVNAITANTNGSSVINQILNPTWSIFKNLPKQLGGEIPLTGNYHLEQGEYVVPKTGKDHRTHPERPVVVHIHAARHESPEQLAFRFQRLIRMKYIEESSSKISG